MRSGVILLALVIVALAMALILWRSTSTDVGELQTRSTDQSSSPTTDTRDARATPSAIPEAPSTRVVPSTPDVQVADSDTDRVTVLVLDENENPVPDARVMTPRADALTLYRWEWIELGRTNDTGIFKFAVDKSIRWVRAEARGFASPTSVLGAAGSRTVLRLERAASIRGRVLDRLGEPIADASVRLSVSRFGVDGVPVSDASTSSDETGRFEFASVSRGTYFLRASDRTRACPDRVVTIDAFDTYEFDLVLAEPIECPFLILLPDGSPAPRARFCYFLERNVPDELKAKGVDRVKGTRADENGNGVARLPFGGDYVFVATADDVGMSEIVRRYVGEDTIPDVVTLRLRAPVTLVGRVVTKSDGQPVAGVRVSANPTPDGESQSANAERPFTGEGHGASATTDASGWYELSPLDEGLDYHIAVIDTGWRLEVASADITVHAGARLDLTIDQRPMTRLTGRVVDERTREGVPGNIELNRRDERTRLRVAGRIESDSRNAAAALQITQPVRFNIGVDGRFDVTVPSDQNYGLTLIAFGGGRKSLSLFVSGSAMDLGEVTLGVGHGTIEITLTTSSGQPLADALITASPRPLSIINAKTDSAGHAKFENLDAGTMKLHFNVGRPGSKTIEVEVRPNEVTRVDVVM